jgi:CheY-like chemotaxis protein/DNA-binding XRE family transcriptional regulator
LNWSSLGAAIRSLRLEHHLTQAMLADKLHITDKAVSKWERDLSYPDISLFPKLADLLGVTVDDLLKTLSLDGQPSKLMRTFTLSQDIRTPIHIILGCADLAETNADDIAKLKRYLKSIRVSAKYLLKTIDQLPAAKDTTSTGDLNTAGENLNTFLSTQEPDSTGENQAVTKYDFSGRHFLIADDLAVNREIAAEILKQTGATTDCAGDGKACIDMIENAPAGSYDLILMDIIMPDINGIEATRKIRLMSDPKKASIPIIALTANIYESERQAAFDAGMNAFAEKPIDIEGLFSAIQKCLEK